MPEKRLSSHVNDFNFRIILCVEGEEVIFQVLIILNFSDVDDHPAIIVGKDLHAFKGLFFVEGQFDFVVMAFGVGQRDGVVRGERGRVVLVKRGEQFQRGVVGTLGGIAYCDFFIVNEI